MINGVMNVYKEKGFTSHDVVAKLRGICKQKKIGHTGTLDPEAEGVLPVCLGSATKLCDMLTDKRKEYVAEMVLGIETDTQDMTGQILKQNEVCVSEEAVREAVASFMGKSEQIPPMYSALKINGKKLYELARAGVEVERKARPIEIFEIEIVEMELPRIKFRVLCSKGTYVRTICYDIGKKLGCGGCMSSLLRTRVERFDLKNALKLSEIESYRDADRLSEIVLPVEEMFLELPKLVVINEFRKLIDNGNAIWKHNLVEPKLVKEARVYNEDGKFYGVYQYDNSKNCYKPLKMFLDR